MRIDKLLGNMGYGTRKEVRQLIKTGAVRINGATVKKQGQQVEPTRDEVTLLGEIIQYEPHIYLLLHKPPGVISATEDGKERTVIDLLTDELRFFEPFPVGRLDKDTEGLLVLTNDGQLAHRLLTPKNEVPKTYYAELDSSLEEEVIRLFSEGVELEDGYQTKPAQLTILEAAPIAKIEVTITEGKFHQVKRMFRAVGKEVRYLKRLSMGSLQLPKDLSVGQYRPLTEEEYNQLVEDPERYKTRSN